MTDPSTDPKEALRNERRTQILKAAMQLFAEKGFHQTTMDDIVRASGLSKGGLYWHFESKDALIAALLEQFFQQEMAGLEQLLELKAPAVERLLKLAEIVAGDITQMAAVQSVAWEFYATAARRQDVRAFLKSYFAGYRQGLATLLQQGFDAGEFDGAAGLADEIAVDLVALYEGLALLWAVDPDSFDLERQCRQGMAIRLNALQGQKESE